MRFRNLFSDTPPELKKILYPLKNNPNLNREAIWAHSKAFSMYFDGITFDGAALEKDLNEKAHLFAEFDRYHALGQLQTLIGSTDNIRKAFEIIEAKASLNSA